LLNSRPLYTLSTDVNDKLASTPGHFAVQRSLKDPPTTFTAPKSSIGLSRKWILVQQLQQEFWNRFQNDDEKDQPQRNLAVDNIVILKDNLSHPLDWPLCRVLKVYPDQKGISHIFSRLITALRTFQLVSKKEGINQTNYRHLPGVHRRPLNNTRNLKIYLELLRIP
uniref:DUF5641 domain-containing protein n=1 Tax=Megaselia scalaris TaxID=36166 RepID=T1GW01_MEGSC